MGRRKKVKVVVDEPVAFVPVESPQDIAPMAVDFPSESLNDMARKINEIIQFINK